MPYPSTYSNNTPTVKDLMRAIESDPSLSSNARQSLLGQLEIMLRGVAKNTSLSKVVSMGLGGLAGYLISKYFGMGLIGRALVTVGGMGLGSALSNAAKPYAKTPGWKTLGSVYD